MMIKQALSDLSNRDILFSMERNTEPQKTVVLIAIAVVLMIIVHLFVFGNWELYRDSFFGGGSSVPEGQQVIVPDDSPLQGENFDDLPQPEPIPNQRTDISPMFEYPLIAEFNNEIAAVEKPIKPPKRKPAYRYALKNPNPSAPARIAIVIDDMGMNRKQSRAAVNIEDVPLTLAFLPYADNLPALTQPAQKNGHELIIHMPMEPMDSKIDTGPIALHNDMPRAQIEEMLDAAFESFDGYVGINNHMGSRLTQNPEAMGWVMESLMGRDLFYLDSKTISTSIAAQTAQEYGLDYAERDVFLDHEESISFVRNALQKAEKVALKKGHAIAIGHPKAVTMQGLKEWIPTLKKRGFEIVPVSALLMGPQKNETFAKVKVEDLLSVEELLAIEPASGEAEIKSFPEGLYQLPSQPPL